MGFLYKIGFYCSFDKNNQKWVNSDFDELAFEKYKNYFSGKGILPELFFQKFILYDSCIEESLKITNRLYENKPSFNKFLLKVQKKNKNINEDEIKDFWINMSELLDYLSNDTKNIWTFMYKFE